MAINSVTASNYYLQTALNSPVSVSVALAALKINPIAKIQISDTTANINNNLDTLTKYANNLTQIGFSDTGNIRLWGLEHDQHAIQLVRLNCSQNTTRLQAQYF
jgi:hypothetical protein